MNKDIVLLSMAKTMIENVDLGIMSLPGSAIHWLITTTAMLNSSATRTKSLKCWPSFCCLSDSSPLPENSTRNKAMILSMINSRKGPWSGSASSAAIGLTASI